MFGGKAVTPVVVRTMWGAGIRAASQHSQALYPIFTHVPGPEGRRAVEPLRRQGPAHRGDPRRRPGDLLRAQGALRDARATSPRSPTRSPSARPNIVREGGDVTVVAIGRMVHARRRRRRSGWPRTGIECEIVDPRTTSPLDEDTIFESVENDRPARGGRRGQPALRPRVRHRRARRRGVLRLPARRAPKMVTAAAHAGAVQPGARGRSTCRAPAAIEEAVREVAGGVSGGDVSGRARPRRQARHAEVGPLDDGGHAPRLARRGGRRARGRRRGRGGRDREDQRAWWRRRRPACCAGGSRRRAR